MRWLKRSVIGVSALALGAVALDASTYDANAWIGDYERLKRDMAQAYANLDWQAEHKNIDLAALDSETKRRLEGARSRVLATLALRDFLGKFEDPHLKLEYASRGEGGGQRSQSSLAGAAPPPEPIVSDCNSVGFLEDEYAFRLPLAQVDGTRAVQSSWFPAAINGAVGIIRIAAFGEDRYRAACQSAFRPGMTEHELKLATRVKLQDELKATIARLKAAGSRHMLVDVTGNGGGTEWVSEVIALFTDRRLTRSEARLVGPVCDRSSVWTGAKPTCAVFGAEPEGPAEIEGVGLWKGSIVILGDRGSGSATEDFIAWLIDNDAAEYAGERSAGAGCGYVNGGNPTYLRVAPLVVRMPNCARFRKDGTNEVAGIEPAIPVELSRMNEPEQKAALAKLIQRMQRS